MKERKVNAIQIKIGKDCLSILKDPKPKKPRAPDMACIGYICVPRKSEVDFADKRYMTELELKLDPDVKAYYKLYRDKNIKKLSLDSSDDSEQIGFFTVSRKLLKKNLNKEVPSESELRKLIEEELGWLNDYFADNVFYYIYTSEGNKDRCYMFYGISGINNILKHFKLPFTMLPDGLCLHMKDKHIHTKKHVYAKCKYIQTKDGIKEMVNDKN